MQHESLRDICRRLVENYRLKRNGSPCRLAPADQILVESLEQGAAVAQQVPRPTAEDVAEMLTNNPALWFYLNLTDADVLFLQACEIDADG